MIETKNLCYEYLDKTELSENSSVLRALSNVNVEIKDGEFVAILGCNGSGKSTLAKMINALLLPTEGCVYINDMVTTIPENVIKIRQNCGMVFQNPDNQIIASVVEEDVGFGPENLCIPTEEIIERVNESLEKVDLIAFKNFSPNKLSGGQKQRVAIAGVLAMKPRCIILDEPTAMLDPRGRKEVIDTICKLNKEEGVTIVLITHYMFEVLNADKVIIMDDGKVAMVGKPEEIFKNEERIGELGLELPLCVQLASAIRKEGYNVDLSLDEEKLIKSILELKK